MSLGTPVGLVLAFGVIVAGILFLGGDIGDFLDAPSLLIVVIPTFCALAMAYPIKELLAIGKHMKIAIKPPDYNPLQYVNIMTEMAQKARAQGLLALEAEVENMDDQFVKSAVMMVADATDPEIVESRLFGVVEALGERHGKVWSLYDKGAAFGPAFGMVGTLVGLVIMLMNIDFADAGGVAKLGMSMSAALITTLYGSMLANLFFAPIGAKLRSLHATEVNCKEIVIEGVLAIQRGINPRVVKEMLLERLAPAIAAAEPVE
ncbi:MAG: MotA/TolQ/ExbB proton channel family protein [Oscillospiraceae bacterium]|nr:MotA/TolQ/ExbB proton channel family protein [Oscillospiraceae bacterium]